MRSLFLHNPLDLGQGTEGGVQICTKEFLDIVRDASDHTEPFEVHVARHPLLRLKRKLHVGSYLLFRSSDYAADLARTIHEHGIDTVFVNRAELIRFAPALKEIDSELKVVLMSHGNQSGDDLYEVAGQGGERSSGASRGLSTWELGRDLVFESRYRHQHLDAVCVMSEEEEVLEKWLGAQATTVLPRLIEPAPLDWQPVCGRAGFVGTLNHTPNRVALEEVFASLAALAPSGLEVRLVGRPAELGEAFEARFPFVTYLGGLSDEELKAEAATWSLFLNPIMWLSRGASMKLGQGLSWGLPVVSTQSGRRGYEWQRGDVLTTPDHAPAFARAMAEVLGSEGAVHDLREESQRAADSAPSVKELAERVLRLRETLDAHRGRLATSGAASKSI